MHIIGNYTLRRQNIYVTITKKPPIFSCAMAGVRFGQLTGTFPVEVAPQAAFATSRAEHTDDILPHISAPHHIAARASSTKGRITLLGMIQICYALSNDEVQISAELKTPLGDISLGSATLNVSNPSITLGGGVAGF